jgi:predicted nuclease of restriction endonuclease-like RecB superfamily
VPDFRLIHRSSGRAVYLEVLGYWRRATAETHIARLRKYVQEPFVLAVSDRLKLDDEECAGLPAEVHRFRQMPLPDEIVELAAGLIR